ncbi:MAG: sensor histidine kinase [bacterium]
MFKKRKLAEIISHIIIWAGLYLLAVAYIRTIGVFNRADNTLFLPITIGTLFNAVIFYSIAFGLIPRYVQKGKTLQFSLEVLGVYTGFTLLETILDYHFMVWIYSDVRETFSSMLLTNFVVHLLFVSVALGYGFTRNWLLSEKKKQELEREKLTAELNFLKTQLNPHFLFNVLNMAYSSASRKGDDQTAGIIEKLSVLMRYMLYESNVDKIEVEREIEFIRNYINLQKMRFSKDLPVTVNFSIQGNYNGQRIAPLILVSFIENAFKHGVKLEKKSEITLNMNFHNGEMEFYIRNDVFKDLQPGNKKASGIGLKNTQKRLSIIYPHRHKLSMESAADKFTVKLLLTLD